MLPFTSLIVPLFIMFSETGLINTTIALIIKCLEFLSVATHHYDTQRKNTYDRVPLVRKERGPHDIGTP